jgi:hypothetical protein
VTDHVLPPSFVRTCERAGIDAEATCARMIEAACGRVGKGMPRESAASMVRLLIMVEALVQQQFKERTDPPHEYTAYWITALLDFQKAGQPPTDCQRMAMYSTWCFAAVSTLRQGGDLDPSVAVQLGNAVADAAWDARGQAVADAHTQRQP